jgi:citrate synthase
MLESWVSDELYISAADAAELLGVTPNTLYSYVSRKSLRSFPVEGTRQRRYWRADIEALRSGEDAGRDVDHVLARTTALTLLTDAGLFYRGQDVIFLAERSTLESIAALLWDADPTCFDGPLDSAPAHLADLLELHRELPPLDRALSVLPSIEYANPRSSDLSPIGFARTSASVIRWFAALIADRGSASDEPIHLVVSRGAVPDGRYDDLVRRALVLTADHELDPVTYVVRAAGNVGCTPYGAALSGLVGGRGQRQRHRHTHTTVRFVRDVLESRDPDQEVTRLYRMGEAIPGFEPLAVHRQDDPRSRALLGAMREQLVDDADFRKLDQAIVVATDLTGQSPQFILPLVFLGLKLGYHHEPATFSAPGRMVGWLAQALEQRLDGKMVRPRAAYVGALPARGQPVRSRKAP